MNSAIAFTEHSFAEIACAQLQKIASPSAEPEQNVPELALLHNFPSAISEVNWTLLQTSFELDITRVRDLMSRLSDIAAQRSRAIDFEQKIERLTTNEYVSDDILLTLYARKLFCLQKLVDNYKYLAWFFSELQDSIQSDFCQEQASYYGEQAQELLLLKLEAQLPNACNEEAKLLKSRTILILQTHLLRLEQVKSASLDSYRVCHEIFDTALCQLQALLDLQTMHYRETLGRLLAARDELYSEKQFHYRQMKSERSSIEQLSLLSGDYRHIKAKLEYIDQLSKSQSAFRKLFRSGIVLAEQGLFTHSTQKIDRVKPELGTIIQLAINYLSCNDCEDEKVICTEIQKVIKTVEAQYIQLHTVEKASDQFVGNGRLSPYVDSDCAYFKKRISVACGRVVELRAKT